MTVAWVQRVTGSLQHKARYRRYKARTEQLPDGYRTTVRALERYLLHTGAVTRGDAVVSMLEDLVDLLERRAAQRVPVRAVVGEVLVRFAGVFLRSCTHGRWMPRERRRLTAAIDRAAEQERAPRREVAARRVRGSVRA